MKGTYKGYDYEIRRVTKGEWAIYAIFIEEIELFDGELEFTTEADALEALKESIDDIVEFNNPKEFL